MLGIKIPIYTNFAYLCRYYVFSFIIFFNQLKYIRKFRQLTQKIYLIIQRPFLLEPSYTSRSSSFKFASALLIVLIEHPSFSAISFRLMRLFSFISSIIFSLILFWGSSLFMKSGWIGISTVTARLSSSVKNL